MSVTTFLWGGGAPLPTVESFTPRKTDWWNQYVTQLGWNREAVDELSRASKAILGLLPDPISWGTGARPFRGLIAGAVQSGKTSSMIGVTAVALDQGFRIVVVLAGGKDDLRQQTARRFNTLLLRQSDPIPGAPGLQTLPPSVGNRPLGGFALPFAQDAHQFNLLRIKMWQALGRDQPVVLVVKKNVASLEDVRAH